MARMKPDYDSLLVQDFLTKEQAMAAVWYTILPAALGFAVDGMLKGN